MNIDQQLSTLLKYEEAQKLFQETIFEFSFVDDDSPVKEKMRTFIFALQDVLEIHENKKEKFQPWEAEIKALSNISKDIPPNSKKHRIALLKLADITDQLRAYRQLLLDEKGDVNAIDDRLCDLASRLVLEWKETCHGYWTKEPFFNVTTILSKITSFSKVWTEKTIVEHDENVEKDDKKLRESIDKAVDSWDSFLSERTEEYRAKKTKSDCDEELSF